MFMFGCPTAFLVQIILVEVLAQVRDHNLLCFGTQQVKRVQVEGIT